MSNDLVDAMVHMRESEAMELAQKMLAAGEDPLQVLDLCREALEIVGKRFEAGKYFLPELIMSGEMLKKISEIAKPFIQPKSNQKHEVAGKVVIGSVKGDIHDIGKDMVTFMLDINGFEVHDLGVDVPAEKFVEAIKAFQPEVVGMSALLTTAFESMKNTVAAIKDAGLRDQVRIMVGGGSVDEKVRAYSGADAYGTDAVAAVNLSKGWVTNK
ncbi:MAG: cobalamin-dependent protein [Deltaproteobacteria bacterium]|jgi:methanogenic corrinoid protein MtbC1